MSARDQAESVVKGYPDEIDMEYDDAAFETYLYELGVRLARRKGR